MSAFDSNEYAWKDLKAFGGDRMLSGLRGIKFGVERTMTDIYASGDEPHTRTKGNKKYPGEVELLQSEIEALLEYAQSKHGKNADLTDLTIDITVAFAASPTDRIKTHQLVTCDFPKFEMGMKQDDSNMVVTLPIMIGKVLFNV